MFFNEHHKPVIEKSTGIGFLDNLTIKAINASAPFPKFPLGLNKPNLNVMIHFRYVH